MNIIEKKRAIPKSTSLTAQTPVSLSSDNNVFKWITSVNTDWGKHIFPRMDEDERLWTQEPYVLKDAKDSPLDDVVNITMNDARVFGERVLAVLNESQEVIEVNGQRHDKELDGHETALIENWWYDLLYLANEHLTEILLPELDTYLWEQVCIRGRMGARILLYQDGDTFDVDILPVDMRKCVYSVGSKGLRRVAFWDTLDEEACKEGYPGYKPKGGIITRWDCWDNEQNIIFLNGDIYDAVDNKLGHPPFVIQLCQQGTFLDTSPRALSMRGDSLFSANRQLYPELNRIASIMQTQNMLTLSPPQAIGTEEGKATTDEPIYRLGRQVPLKANEWIRKIESPDIQASTRFFQALLGGALQRGSISHIDWGNLQFQLSQVAIATLAGASRQVFSPRLNTMARFKRLLAKEAIWQFKAFNMTAKIGRVGKQRTYTAKDIDGDYTMDFEYLAALPEEVAASYGLAQMASRWMDDRSIRKTILKYRDYDDIDEKYLVQTAKKVSRSLALFEMAQALDKQGLKDEAKILLVEIGQALQGVAPREKITTRTPEASPQEKAQALMLGGGGPVEGAVRTTRASESPGMGELEEETSV
jgi:hypothetical protein